MKSRIATDKQHSTRTTSFHQHNALNLRKKTNEITHLEHSLCMVLQLGHFAQ